MIRASEIIWFNGHSSEEFGLINANIDNDGFLDEPFLAERKLNIERIKYQPKVYFDSVEEQEKTFELKLVFKDRVNMNKQKLRDVAKWLNATDGYKELWFSEDCELDENGDYDINKPTRIYFAIVEGTSNLHHACLPQGYITIRFRTNSPYCYSPLKTTVKYKLGEGDRVVVFNEGDMIYRPEVSIKSLVENQTIQLKSNTFEPDNYIDYINNESKNKFDFIFKQGEKAKGSFDLDGTAYDGETFKLGNKTYEFDLGDNKTKNKYDVNNILVPVSGGSKAHNTLNFEKAIVTDGSTVTIGDQTFEFDNNNIYAPSNVQVDVSDYCDRAKGTLHLNSNLMPNQTMKIDETTYTMVGGTNEFIIKMTDHLLSDGLETNIVVKNDKINAKQDNVVVTTPKFKNIDKCLVRNVTKNPSDLGIRKVKYLDKDFVMVLWDGESDEDYQDLIEDVGINDRVVIKFDRGIDKNTVTEDTIVVKDLEGNKVPVLFDFGQASDMGKIVGVIPKNSYDYDSEYTIHITRGVKNEKGVNIKNIRKIKIHTRKEHYETENEVFNNISPVKAFTFNSPHKFKKETVTKENIYVLDDKNEKVQINLTVTDAGKSLIVQPVTKYEQGKTYKLYFTTKVLDINNMSVVRNEKIVTFTTSTKNNIGVIDTDCDDYYNDVPIDKPFTIPFPKRLNLNQINYNYGLVDLRDRDNKQIAVFYSYKTNNTKLLEITPSENLKYGTTYFLYISKMVQYDDQSGYIDEPLKIRINTIKDPSLQNNNNNNDIEESQENTVNTNFYNVATNKEFNVSFNASVVDIRNGIYIKNSKEQFVNCFTKISQTGNGIDIFPSPVWEMDEKYYVYGNENIKLSKKPRIFAGDSPPDGNGNKGDYANAKEIFEPLGLQVIKIDGWKIYGGDIYDKEGKKIFIDKRDILVGGNFRINKDDYNDDGTLKDGTIIYNIPLSVFANGATRISGVNRVETKKKMLEYKETIKDRSYVKRSMYKTDTLIMTFSVDHRNNSIEIDVDRNISLSDNRLLLNKYEIPKKIKNMRAKDDIYIYEESEMDFTVDANMLIPNKVPMGAKVYAGVIGNVVNGVHDDYTNATNILSEFGYKIIDTSQMTYQEKQNITFKVGDLVIGGLLAGITPSDLDSNGNVKATPPQADNPNDRRKERMVGIPRGINIYPAKRLQGDVNHPNRDGTKKAIEDWAMLLKRVQNNEALGDGYETNIALNGITVKYKVPKNAKIYGTGADIFNAIRYLGDMGYAFVNVGDMTFEEKLALPFKKGDIVVGGIGAADTVVEGNVKKKVYGIPNIPINGALRLGGVTRFDTEKKIKDFAEKLKVKSIEAGDIVKIKMTISTPDNDIINSDEDFEKLNETISNDVRVEYHRVKSTKELSRNRIYIEFEENIRTINYISTIEITDLYKMYNSREAEDYLFTAPNQIRIGYTKNETLQNIVMAINDTGTAGIEYSQRTFKHKTVSCQRQNDDENQFLALEMGEKGNVVTHLVDKVDVANKFLAPTLTGGKDCEQSNAIKTLAKTIEEQNEKPERYNKDKYTCTYDTNTLTVTHMLYGEKYNNIICLSNVTKLVQTPYLINEKDIGKLEEFLNREKQIAKWEHPTFVGGIDPTSKDCILALYNKILENQNSILNLDIIDKTKYGRSYSGINIEYKDIGEEGNILIKTTCVNGILSGKKLKGGLDGLEENEFLYINCDKEEIVSSIDKDRYKNFNHDWVRIPPEKITIMVVQGKIELQFRYREVFLI
ncbi:Ig-like domain-containing protein [Clostridium botulinum]